MKPLVGYEWPAGYTKQVAYVSQDHHIHEFCVGVEGRWQHTDLTMQAGAPVAYSRFLVGYEWPAGGTKQVAYLGPDNHIHELWVSVGGTWQHTDLTMLTGAPPAIQITAGYSWSVDNSQQIVFVGDDHHIHELYVEAGKPWRHADLTVLTKAPLPSSYMMVGYGWVEGRKKQVAYVGQDSHIHELYMEIGGMWQHIDLSAITNAPRAVNIMAGYEWPEGRCKQIAFVSADHHIHELYQGLEQRWQHVDLSTITNAPPATDVITGYAWPEGRRKQIAYVGQDERIYELSVETGQQWILTDLTSIARAPLTTVSSIVGFAWSAGNSKQVTYVGNDGAVRELWMPRTGNWTYTDLSELVMALPARF